MVYVIGYICTDFYFGIVWLGKALNGLFLFNRLMRKNKNLSIHVSKEQNRIFELVKSNFWI